MPRILVVDDNVDMLKLIANILELQDYEIVTKQAVNLPLDIKEFQGFDLILLDIMMPKLSGIEICSEIRDKVVTPIIFVSAMDSEEDILEGFDAGGDDYITKPFSIKQLLARVNANLRREERRKIDTSQNYSIRNCSPILFYLEEKVVKVNDVEVHLTNREYHILDLLSAQPHRLFSHEDIYEEIYTPDSDALFHSISEYVYQLRKKFMPFNINPIKTVRGMGYKWYDN